MFRIACMRGIVANQAVVHEEFNFSFLRVEKAVKPTYFVSERAQMSKMLQKFRRVPEKKIAEVMGRNQLLEPAPCTREMSALILCMVANNEDIGKCQVRRRRLRRAS